MWLCMHMFSHSLDNRFNTYTSNIYNCNEQSLMINCAKRDYGVWKSVVRAISICVRLIVRWWLMLHSRETCPALSIIVAVPTRSYRNGNCCWLVFNKLLLYSLCSLALLCLLYKDDTVNKLAICWSIIE